MGFFSKIFSFSDSKQSAFDYAVLKTDVHSHLIPGIDDGSQSMEETVSMLQYFCELGYTKVITTPHVMIDYYKNTPEIISQGLDEVKKEIEKLAIPIQIEAAAEYYLDEYFLNLIKEKKILTFGGQYVLFELSFNAESPYVKEAIFEMVTAGYKPVMAHVERYPFYHGNIEKMRDFKARGALLQLNLNSLSGNYGPEVKKMAIKLIENDLIDLVSSDCHRMEHLETMNLIKTNKHLKKLNISSLINTKL